MSTTNEAVKLASVPIVDRGIGWQADATATLKAQAAQIEMLTADVLMLKKRLEEAQALADSEGSRAVAYLRRARKAEDLLSRFEPLRARGVVDADDNLDCWDTAPFDLCAQHVTALNEKDPAARWRVVELWARELQQPLTWEEAVRSTITDPAVAERILSVPRNATPEQARALLRTETMDEAGAAAAALYDRWTGKA